MSSGEFAQFCFKGEKICFSAYFELSALISAFKGEFFDSGEILHISAVLCAFLLCAFCFALRLGCVEPFASIFEGSRHFSVGYLVEFVFLLQMLNLWCVLVNALIKGDIEELREVRSLCVMSD
jgi:uncharacterized membrane protein